jgi:hypothetical protein
VSWNEIQRCFSRGVLQEENARRKRRPLDLKAGAVPLWNTRMKILRSQDTFAVDSLWAFRNRVVQVAGCAVEVNEVPH